MASRRIERAAIGAASGAGKRAASVNGRQACRLVAMGMMLAAGTLAAAAETAPADVKAGVEAMSRGEAAMRQGNAAEATRAFGEAVRIWTPLARNGDADAEYDLAQAYKAGKGVPQDLAIAEALYGKAAAQGHVMASDMYGLLLFQRGEHTQAMPYIKAAADHGDPRAQYLLGIALFNGDGMTKDWVRAYALVSLAQQQGLPQAQAAMAQMDQYIPLEQRQKAASVAPEIAAQSEANRSRQMTAMDLGTRLPAAGAVPAKPPAAPAGTSRARAPSPLSAPVQAPVPAHVSGPVPAQLPATIAARPRPVVAMPSPVPAPPPVTRPRPVAAPVTAPPVQPAPAPVASPAPHPVAAHPAPQPANHAAPPPATGGNWRIQFGAFGVPANADALWSRLRTRPEVSGHARIDLKAGAVTRLLAGGYSETGARAACHSLTSAGLACLPVGN